MADTSDILDHSLLTGEWINTYKGTRAIVRMVIESDGPALSLKPFGTGASTPVEWGEAQAIVYSEGEGATRGAAFHAHYRMGAFEALLAVNYAKGILVVAAYQRYTDAVRFAPWFTREFFYRV